MFSGGDDMREDLARREFDKVAALEKGGKANPYDMRKRWEAFMAGSYGKMKAGRDAEERLKALPVLSVRPPDNPPAVAPGLEAKCCEKANEDIGLTGLSLSAFKLICAKTVPNIDIPNKGGIGQLADGRQEHVVMRCTGYVEIPREGSYTFYTNSDDGSMLYIGETLVVQNDGAHAMQEREGAIPLAAGKHALRVDYWQGMGDAGLIVGWAGPDLGKQTIPASALSH
jgi:hypothetical protein